MNNLKINLNITAGPNKLEYLNEFLINSKFSNPFLIFDKNLYDKNQYFRNFLDNNNFNFLDKYEYDFEPSYQYVKEKLDHLKKNIEISKVDLIISIGGGSTIDYSKAIALLLKNPNNDPIDFKGFPTSYNNPIPLVAVPTTCGTGTEVVFNASLIDEKTKLKLGINATGNTPVLSILDPKLIINSPKKVLYSSASDTLVHTIEGFTSKKSNEFSKVFSKKSFSLFKGSIIKLLEESNNLNAIMNLQWASSFAMIGMSNSSHGVSGALSYFLGTHYKINHGIAGGFFLRKICRYNHKKGYFGLGELVDDNSEKGSEKVILFIDSIVSNFLSEFDMKSVSKDLKKNSEFKNFLKDMRSNYELNPVDIDQEKILDIL